MASTKLIVSGNEIDFDCEEQLEITDVSEDQKTVAAQMGYWGTLQAEAEREKILADSYYRSWRAKFGQEMLQTDPKIAEWKMRQQIESSEDFTKLKSALAQATYNVSYCKGVFESFKIKANQLQSKGAMMRAELDATGMATKEAIKVSEKKEAFEKKEEEVNDKRKHMKKIFSKK